MSLSIPENASEDLLPRWDLSDLYSSPDAPELREDLERSETEIRAFAATYQGKLKELAPDALGQAVESYEEIEERLQKLMSYAGLLHAENVVDPDVVRFYQNLRERVTDITRPLIFFTLEFNELPDDHLAAALEQSDKLARYRPWIEEMRKFKPHQLDARTEELLHDMSVTGRAAWVRLYDETLAELRFTLPDPETAKMTELTLEEALDRLSHKDGRVRQAAAEELSRVFKDNIRLFALVANTLAKDKEVEDRWRNFPRPESYRHLANQVEPEVVDALVNAVRDAYPRLSHRFYRLKARWMGKDQLDHWDRNAPLPEDSDEYISWDRATKLVLEAYHDFSPEMAKVGARFFENNWIDAPVRKGKATGAFAHPTVPSAHPYLLLNYLGKTRDVMTLAHELGHGVHQVLAGRQGLFLSDTPLTLAETASVFGEMLTFRALLRETTDPQRRRVLIANKVQDMLNTVVRQIAFFTFERELHDRRRQGELSAEDIGEIWLKVQGESLGDGIKLNPGYEVFWCYISHFMHSPFYVYAYAFGDCLVNSLYATYEDAAEGFAERYLELLAAGGSKRHGELLAPFGLDARDPAFWQRGLGTIAALIDELEENL